MPWQAKPGCAEHHRAAVERIANSFPLSWLLAPCTGEVFDNLEHCNRRLRAWAFVEGFDIVRNGGGTGANPSYRFRCIFHGTATRNSRKLEDRVERDEEGRIVSKRRREATSARQLQCPWSALCSFKDIGKRGSGDKGFVLTIQCEDHQNTSSPRTHSSFLRISNHQKNTLKLTGKLLSTASRSYLTQ